MTLEQVAVAFGVPPDKVRFRWYEGDRHANFQSACYQVVFDSAAGPMVLGDSEWSTEGAIKEALVNAQRPALRGQVQGVGV